MDEIKFRGWDGKKMRFFDLFDKPRNDWSVEHIMLYTNLKDKNGKEIYESDICREVHPDNFDAKYTFNLVEFGDFTVGSGDYEDPEYNFLGWGYKSRIQYKDRKKYSDTLWDELFPLSIKVVGGWEVIGNIYENPELL